MTTIKLFKDRVIVADMEFGSIKTAGGIILGDDDGKHYGIKPRWGKVVMVGPDNKELAPGDYVLLKHGRWTRGYNVDINGEETKIFMIDFPDAVLLVSKERPEVFDYLMK